MRSFESDVLIELNAAMIWLADVRTKNYPHRWRNSAAPPEWVAIGVHLHGVGLRFVRPDRID
jgi:hypothetical protein